MLTPYGASTTGTLLPPPPLAELIRQHSATATPAAVLGGRGHPTSWLFPGQVPGRHLTVNGLVRHLNDHGVQARISRSATLINLAADLPAAVLADLLGMHINTDVRWAHRSRRDWTIYLAARTSAAAPGPVTGPPGSRQPDGHRPEGLAGSAPAAITGR